MQKCQKYGFEASMKLFITAMELNKFAYNIVTGKQNIDEMRICPSKTPSI